MNMNKTLIALTAAGMLGAMTASTQLLADASDEAKVNAMELQSDIQLHPELGAYGLSVRAMDDGTLAIEGMIDDQKGYDALNQMIEDKTEGSNMQIENNVVKS